MSPPSSNSGPLSDVFKAKVSSVIQEQLKPIITELAAQQQTLLTHLALLKHNHNVNDYQMARLENIRNLEQSIKYAYSVVHLPIAPLTEPNSTASRSRAHLASARGRSRAWGPTYASPSRRTP
jgi:hypothetical protein